MEGKPGAGAAHIKSEIHFRHPCGDVKFIVGLTGKKFTEEACDGDDNLGVVS